MADHHCHLPGCTVATPRSYLFCPRHWRQVPKEIRDRVWAAYRDAGGDKGPIARVTPEYIAATKAAEVAVLSLGGK